MKLTGREVGRIFLASVFGLILGFPVLFWGGALIYSWVLTKTTDRFYVEYPYLRAGSWFALVGLLSLASFARWMSRRTSAAPALVAALVNLFWLNLIGGEGPLHQHAAAKAAHYLYKVGESSERWYDSHGVFPASEAELRESLQTDPDRTGADRGTANSAYSRTNKRLTYEIVVQNMATGPRTGGLSARPAVIYYCISADRRQFWATITVLPTDVARASTLARDILEPNHSPLVVHSREMYGSRVSGK